MYVSGVWTIGAFVEIWCVFLLNFDYTASREYDGHSNNNIDDDLFWLDDKNFFFPKVDYDFLIRIF